MKITNTEVVKDYMYERANNSMVGISGNTNSSNIEFDNLEVQMETFLEIFDNGYNLELNGMTITLGKPKKIVLKKDSLTMIYEFFTDENSRMLKGLTIEW